MKVPVDEESQYERTPLIWRLLREDSQQPNINVDALIQKGAYMGRDKYMGMDVHQATTVVAVIDAEGKIVLETIVPTAAGAIRRLIESISGPLHVTLEETTQAEWLHDLLEGFVAEVVVCDPRRNKLLAEGSKGDKADARKLAELLRTGMVRSVWHGRQTTRSLKEMVRSYETFAADTRRTMLRIKALY